MRMGMIEKKKEIRSCLFSCSVVSLWSLALSCRVHFHSSLVSIER